MNDKIRALMEKALSSLRAAKLLVQQGYPDYAASRSYYAMFYIAQALLLEVDLSFSSHSAVIAAFGKEFARTGKMDARFHRYLIDAQDYRNQGDYDVGSNVTNDQSMESIGWAEEFLKESEKYLGFS